MVFLVWSTEQIDWSFFPEGYFLTCGPCPCDFIFEWKGEKTGRLELGLGELLASVWLRCALHACVVWSAFLFKSLT